MRRELIAGPATKANRVLVVDATSGDLSVIEPQTISGSTDDRKQSIDKRQGRLMTVGCTAWLVADDVMLSVGHCVANRSNQILEFNVPKSTSSGGKVRSHPNDQYPVITSTVKYLNSGVGKDWGIGRLAANSNTKKLPGVARGGFHEA